MPSSQHIGALEAILFISGEPVSFAKISTLLDISKEEVRALVRALAERYAADEASGLLVIEHRDQVELATKKEHGALMEEITRSTLQEELSKPALEVLAIVAYRAPIARSEIEAIRGVNCSYTLRNLLIRGLIEREGNPEDARGYVYRPSFPFLEKLGLGKVEDLPDYANLSHDERLNTIETDREHNPS